MKSQGHSPIQTNVVMPSHTPPPSPHNTPLKDHEEEVAKVLEKMGMFGEGIEKYVNVKGHKCTSNQSTSFDSPGCDQTLPFTNSLEE